jgi:hypothetical protein
VRIVIIILEMDDQKFGGEEAMDLSDEFYQNADFDERPGATD